MFSFIWLLLKAFIKNLKITLIDKLLKDLNKIVK